MKPGMLAGGLTLVLAAAGCGSDPDPAAPAGGPRVYLGDFECTEIDADTARVVWDAGAGTGTFGWVPSNSPTDDFVARPITSLKFEVVFSDVLGLDRPGVAETVTVKFDLTPSDGGKKLDGPGTLTRASGTVETCQSSFR
jgi:hypothetical protein